MKNLNRVLWGILLVVLGLAIAARAFGLDLDIFFEGWWTLFIIIPCAVGLFTKGSKTENLIGLIVGVCLLLACRDVISFSLLWQLLLPAIIVLIGLRMIFGGLFHRNGDAVKEELKQDGKQPVSKCAAFSGQNVTYDGEPFHGATLTAVFGGVECDLRHAVLEHDCVIDVCAVFGGIDILVPEHVNVTVNCTAFFGGVEDKRCKRQEKTVTIYVQGLALFGGVDIKS